MGYEVLYKFYNKKEDEPGYEMDSPEELKASVGDPFEEVTLEELAGAIMAQFARRDIMVFDAQIIELSRKEISFKETTGGIILKNKKYSFDQGTKLHVQDVVQALPSGVMPHEALHPRPQPSIIPPITPQNSVIPYDEELALQEAKQAQADAAALLANKPPAPRIAGKTPLRYEVYDSDKILALEAAKRGYKFTQGQRYPVYEERVSPSHGMYDYSTVDDAGQPRTVASNHFQPETKGQLIGDFQQDKEYGGLNTHDDIPSGVPAEMLQVPNLRG
jgi:hypothetical protein